MIVALTNASLDITLGIAWWTFKQVISGTYYLGTYLLSNTSKQKKNLILGQDTNFVPYSYPTIELEIVNHHSTINKVFDTENMNKIEVMDNSLSLDDSICFEKINHTECTVLTKETYFCIPLKDIINKSKSKELPLWIVSFLNTYPLTNYSLIQLNNDEFKYINSEQPIYSAYILSNHLKIKNINDNSNLLIYLKKIDIDTVLNILNNSIHTV